MIVSKLKEFSGYTSIHGLGRIGDVKFIVRKLFWICVCLASFSMAVYQIYRLVGQYTSESVNTKISTSYSALDFPSVTFCNLNPLSYKIAKTDPEFYNVVNATANALNIDISMYDTEIKPTTDRPAEIYITGDDAAEEGDLMIRLDMGEMADFLIHQFVAPQKEFIIKCKYQNVNCSSWELKQVRDEYYGTCYTFTPTQLQTKFAGPTFALDLLLNVQQDDYLPLVTQSAGIRLSVHPNGTKPFLTSKGISITTGFETHVVLQQKKSIRYAGSKGDRCDQNNTYSGVLPCIEACIGQQIAKSCNCLNSYDYRTNSVTSMCQTQSELLCKDQVEYDVVQKGECGCKMPCSLTTYDQSIFMTRYPARNYEAVLQNIINSTAENLSESLVRVKVFFPSPTVEHFEEELAYTDENFVSDIGGQLGLWAGFSVLSLAELVELIVILIHACFERKKTVVDNFEKD